MSLSHEVDARRRVDRRMFSPLRVVAAGGLVAAGVLAAAIAGDETPSSTSLRGSGVPVTERRDVAAFAALELAGSNTVEIHVGGPQSVSVTGDDNLVGRVTTVVRDGRLVIDDTGSFTTTAPMRVAVSVPSLDGVVLRGTGTVTVDGLAGRRFDAELAGDGTLVAGGVVEDVTATLTGTGTIDLHGLAAVDGRAQLDGTGTIRVRATSSLDATLTGTGTILYGGDPAVTMRNTGTGTVVPE